MILSVSASDATEELSALRCHYRKATTTQYQTIEQTASGQSASEAFIIPGGDVGEYGVEYYLEALDNFGALSTYANAASPVHVSTTGNLFLDLGMVRISATHIDESDPTQTVAQGNVSISLNSANSIAVGFDGVLLIDQPNFTIKGTGTLAIMVSRGWVELFSIKVNSPLGRWAVVWTRSSEIK